MVKHKSLVWQVFDKFSKDGIPYVLCKLCDMEFKFFGNTTNLKSHLVRKHPIQWELLTTGNLDESAKHQLKIENVYAEDSSEDSPRDSSNIYQVLDKNVRYSVSVNPQIKERTNVLPRIEIKRHEAYEQSDHEEPAIELVRNMHRKGSDEEWLEEDPFHGYEPKKKKVKLLKIKREKQSPHRNSFYRSTPKIQNTPLIISEPQPLRDEYSVFGEYVANKIRKVQTPKTRGNLQQLITTILWQAEYGTYDNQESVKRVLMLNNPEKEEETKLITEVNENVEVELAPNDSLT